MTTLQSNAHDTSFPPPLLSFFDRPDQTDHRGDARRPSFSVVTLRSLNGSGLIWRAFSRDVSRSGIGLLHTMPLKRGDVYEVVLRERGLDMRRPAEVVWCQSVGAGWYCSGWQFAPTGKRSG